MIDQRELTKRIQLFGTSKWFFFNNFVSDLASELLWEQNNKWEQ